MSWHQPFSSLLDCPPFAELEARFALRDFTDWPNAKGLNALRTRLEQHNLPCPLPAFVAQQQLAESDLYYEQIIAQQHKVPTRCNNWHDLFNALIWLSFPLTKARLNQLHIHQISEHGLTPRTPVRDRITHFDECGVVLAVTDLAYVAPLAEHDWQQAFIGHRERWLPGTQQAIWPVIFGHANLEMLLTPFIGLTGKWLAVEVPASFAQLPLAERDALLDERLLAAFAEQAPFAKRGRLKPLPLLGVPGWHAANRDNGFYQNTDYFRPKRQLA